MGRKRKLRAWNATYKRYDHVYGGLLTENVVQAMSRDILAEGMMALEVKGHPVLLTVHDEVVSLVREDVADTALETALHSLSNPGSWADGCPLAAEGMITERYTK
jgi:DNA polymerase